MKNIVIIGVGRAGKTTLSNMIKDKWNEYSIIHSDSIKWGIIRGKGEEPYYRKNIKAQKEWEHGDEFQKTLVEIYKSCVNKDEKGYGILLESGQLEPRYVKELIDKYNVYCICLGHGDLDKQGIIDLCRKNDKEKDWSYGIADEDLDAHAEKWAETNENLKVECPKYGIEYIDTHINREEILNKIMDKLEKEIK